MFTLWQVLQLLTALPCLLLPYIMQARESLHPPMNTPSLGTFGIVMVAAAYFLVVSPINSIIFGAQLHWPWYLTLLLALIATAIGVLGSYFLLYNMATKGGKLWTIVGGVGLAVLFSANMFASNLAKRASTDPTHQSHSSQP